MSYVRRCSLFIYRRWQRDELASRNGKPVNRLTFSVPSATGFPSPRGQGKRCSSSAGVGVSSFTVCRRVASPRCRHLRLSRLCLSGRRFSGRGLPETGRRSRGDGGWIVRGQRAGDRLVRQEPLSWDVVYACGPLPLLRAVSVWLEQALKATCRWKHAWDAASAHVSRVCVKRRRRTEL